jgi:hypothetical protein
MKERLNCLLSEVGESFDYLRSDVRNLGRYLAELEELIEGYRTFAAKATFPTPADQAAMRKLLKRTQAIIGPPPDKPEDTPGTDAFETSAVVLVSRQAARQL